MLHSCGNIYLSITPGKFQFFEDIKSCERATYTFINELEDGGKVKITGVQGGSGEQKGEDEEEEVEEFSQEAIMRRRQRMKELLEAKENAKKEAKKKAEEAKAPKKVVKIIAAEKKDWKIGDKCLAFWWEDKNFYEASIRQVSKKNGSFCCTFTEYGNSVVLRPEQIIPVGTKVTKELRTSAYYLYQEDQKKKKALAVEKAAKKKAEKRRGRRR